MFSSNLNIGDCYSQATLLHQVGLLEYKRTEFSPVAFFRLKIFSLCSTLGLCTLSGKGLGCGGLGG